MSHPLSNYRLSFTNQQSQNKAHCNKAFRESFQTHAQNLFLRHWPEAPFAERRETAASRNAAPYYSKTRGDFQRARSMGWGCWVMQGWCRGDAGPARPTAPCDLGLVLCTTCWITPRKALETLVKHGASAARMPPSPLWEQSPGQRHMCCVDLVP